MRFNKKMRCNEKTIQYQDRTSESVNKKLLTGAILIFLSSVAVAVVVLTLELTLSQTAIGIFLSCLFFVISIFEFALYIKTSQKPYTIVVDSENLYIKHAGGYAIYNKYELGRIVYRPSNRECNTVMGYGKEYFELDNNSIKFDIDGVRVRKSAHNGKKLAFVLISVAQNTSSKKNFGEIFESYQTMANFAMLDDTKEDISYDDDTDYTKEGSVNGANKSKWVVSVPGESDIAANQKRDKSRPIDLDPIDLNSTGKNAFYS